MRLGGNIWRPSTPEDLDALLPTFDRYGLSAVTAPAGFERLSDEDAAAFGERARSLGIVVGESHSRPNLMIRDPEERERRIENLRVGIRKSRIMGVRGVCILVGTVAEEDHLAAPHPYMYTREARAEFREILLRALDRWEPGDPQLLIEPWTTSFFFQPEPIREFLDSVGHPAIGLHLDLMNMVDQYHYYRTTELVEQTFDLLGHYVGGVHFKDLLWDWHHMLLKLDEVPVGQGVIDYPAYVGRVAQLGIDDLCCFVEHFPTEEEYATSFARLHEIAGELGVPFLPRGPAGAAAGRS